MTDHHSVIILTHYPFQRRSVNNDTYLCDGDYVHSWNMIPEIIEAFRTRSLLEKVLYWDAGWSNISRAMKRIVPP